MKSATRVVIIFVSITMGALIFLLALISLLFSTGTKITMEDVLIEEYDTFMIVTNYLASSEYESIVIWDNDEKGTMYADGIVNIIDDQVVESLDVIFELGYGTIYKGNGMISYSMGLSRDLSQGLAYSVNGNTPRIEFLTEIKSVSKNRWYHYVSDFNEWKRQNPNAHDNYGDQ